MFWYTNMYKRYILCTSKISRIIAKVSNMYNKEWKQIIRTIIIKKEYVIIDMFYQSITSVNIYNLLIFIILYYVDRWKTNRQRWNAQKLKRNMKRKIISQHENKACPSFVHLQLRRLIPAIFLQNNSQRSISNAIIQQWQYCSEKRKEKKTEGNNHRLRLETATS